jgi:hypothetical protein
MPSNPGILCYPNFNLNDLNGIKHALLLCDRVSVIAPTATPRYNVPVTPVYVVKPGLGGIASYDIKPEGALAGLLNDCRLDDGTSAVEFIDDYEIAKSRATEFVQALNHDLADSDVAAWEARLRARHPDQDYAWYVSMGFFNEFPGFDVGEPKVWERYRLELVADSQFGDLIKVPFLVGMSLGLSEALWAALDKDLSLFTLDRISAEFLLLRLQRSWKLLNDDGALQDSLDIRLAKGFATSRFSTWTLGFRVPDLFQKITSMPLPQVMDLRRQSDKMQALTAFREGIARIVSDRGLWKAGDFNTFRKEAAYAADTLLKSAFEALDQRKFDIRTIVTAVDLPTAAKSFIGDIPKLFVSGAAAAVGGKIALTGGMAFVPAALIALGCGLAGSAAARFIEEQRERLAQRHKAQFLTYALQLGKAMQQV